MKWDDFDQKVQEIMQKMDWTGHFNTDPDYLFYLFDHPLSEEIE